MKFINGEEFWDTTERQVGVINPTDRRFEPAILVCLNNKGATVTAKMLEDQKTTWFLRKALKYRRQRSKFCNANPDGFCAVHRVRHVLSPKER
jgi:hypothetical protein